MVFSRTRAVLDKTIKDLAQLTFWVYAIGQMLFLAFQAYKIYTNVNRLPYLILYSLLTAITLTTLSLHFILYKYKGKRSVKKTKLGIRLSKYSINLAVIILSLINLLSSPYDLLSLLLTVLSIVLLLAQVIIEFVRFLYEKYSSLILIAVKMDAEPYIEAINKVTHPKEAVYKYFDEKLKSKVKDFKNEEEVEETKSAKEVFVENLANEFVNKHEDKRTTRISLLKESIKKAKSF